MPVNFRPGDWHEEVVGNFSLLTRVSTTPHQRSLGRVLDAVQAQIRRMCDRDSMAALIEFLARASDLPIWAKRLAPALLAITGNRLVDTSELFDLGRVDGLPNFGDDASPTTELWFSPSTRMPLGVSVGTLIAGGRLYIAFRFRHALFSEDAAQRFAGRYVSMLDLLLPSD